MADASSSQLKMADKYVRLVVFVIDICTKSLRDLFVYIVKTDPNYPQFNSIEQYMQFRKADIFLKGSKPLRKIVERMYEAKEEGDTEKMDISLLAFLLKELFSEILQENEIICINEISRIRNFLVHVPSRDSLTNQTFDETWKCLMNAVLTLNKRSGETTSETEVTDRFTTIVETNETWQDLEKSFRVQERLENMAEEVTKRLDYRTIEVEKMTEEGIKLLYDRKDEVEKMTEEGIKRLDDRKDEGIKRLDDRKNEVEKMTEEGIKRLYDKIDEVRKMTEGIKRLYDRKDEGVRELEYMTEDVQMKLAIITKEGIERFYDMKYEVTKSLEYKADEVQDRLNAMAAEVQDRQKATTAEANMRLKDMTAEAQNRLEAMTSEVKERVEFKADEVIKRLEYQAEKVLERFKYMPREESKSKKDATAHTNIERKTEQTVKVPKVKRRIAEEKQESIGDDNAELDPFLCTGNVKKIERLIKLEKLPDQRTLNEMCQVHGRKSKVMMVTCEKICENIKSKHASIEDVWAAYTLQDEGKLTFVITVKETSEKSLRPLRLEKLIKYSFVKQYVGEFSLEGSEVIKRQASSSSRLDKESYQHIQTCISKHSEDLMKKHKYLSIISACSNRSRGFGVSWQFLPENCIVLYVQKKNYIPIDEEPFETRYDNIPIDVREGVFIPYGHTAREKLDPVRMGCQIGGDSFGGTLGCFIDHPRYGVCGLTCAHVLLPSLQLLHLKSLDGGIMKWPLHGMSNDVYQPDDKHSVLGNIVHLIYKEGSSNTCGMDVALFRITDRQPKTANFPDASVISRSGIHSINYDSWRMCSPGRLDLNMAHVVKFGSTTELREGKIKFGVNGS